jgi:radical SAM superfamily enzyme YgiQ (UPF0313 family)
MRNGGKMISDKNKKILLAVLPFWDPQIPPLGIAGLKSYVQPHGFDVSIVDANTKDAFRDILTLYSDTLKKYIPIEKRGNYYKVIYEVLQNHMMAHFNYKNKNKYLALVKLLVQKTFYTPIAHQHASELCDIVEEFYARLKRFFLDLLKQEKPGILGLSVFNGSLPSSLFAFKLAKEIYPHIRTVMGGAAFTTGLSVDSPDFKYFLRRTPYIDNVIVGEGEELFLKYVLNELPQSQKVYRSQDIGGGVTDISSVEIPDFSGLDIEFYPYLSAYTSRSCPFQCSFCSETVLWGAYRKKRPEHIVKELVKLREEHRHQLFLFGDCLINPVVKGLAEEFVNTGISIYWDGYLRVDKEACDIENTLMWRRGGFYRARLGIESGSPHVLEIMGKKITARYIKSALSSLAYAGIKTTTYWVVGHPGETEEDFQETLKLIEECKDDIYEADVTPFQYFYSGQSGSDDWAVHHKRSLLYGEGSRDMLMVRTWTLDTEPSREKTYRRMHRFTRHCNRLGIPNPYSLKELVLADERWKRLQKNAVPPLVEFSRGSDIRENQVDKRLHVAELKSTQLDQVTFGF